MPIKAAYGKHRGFPWSESTAVLPVNQRWRLRSVIPLMSGADTPTDTPTGCFVSRPMCSVPHSVCPVSHSVCPVSHPMCPVSRPVCPVSDSVALPLLQDSATGVPVTLSVDPNGFFLYIVDQNKVRRGTTCDR